MAENRGGVTTDDRPEGLPGQVIEQRGHLDIWQRTEGVSRQMMNQQDTWTGDRAEGTPGHMAERTEGM